MVGFLPRARKWVLILTIVLLILSPLYFSSFKVDAAPAIGSTTVTLGSTADTYVNSSGPETNYGDVNYMYVSANAELDFTYAMFDLSSIPSDANILSAKLKIYLSSTGGDIYGLPADKIGVYYCSDNSWTELGITWNNKPSFNPNPTDTWSFGLLYLVKLYKSWDVTEDVRTALPSGTLTEVLKFESKTGDGYAVFQSTEGTNKPKLEVEYSTEPVFVVHLESIQDTGATNNLGLTTFADYTFSLPTDIDVVASSYQVSYSCGYMFMKWETNGGVTVSDAKAATTTVTVSGDGTLRAVGNAKRLEYTYDHGDPEFESKPAGCIDAVRFTPLFSGQLLMARFYIYAISSYQLNTFKVHVMDENRDDLITPFERTPTSKGWFDVDLSSYGISVNEGTDFYIGMEWIADYNPDLGEDRTSPSGRSWHWNGTDWQEETYSDFMIRAVVGTLIDHVIVDDGTVFHIITESNSTISNFQFIKKDKLISFNVTGVDSTTGFCRVTVPNVLLGGPYTVIVNNSAPLTLNEISNGTHTFLYFTYNHTTLNVNIIGTTVIEDPPVTIDDYDGLWHTTDFTITLTATDDLSGVAETYYKINDGPIQNVSIHEQPLITTESASNTLEYWSVDKAGNEEKPHNLLTNIKLDETVPSGSIIINDGDSYTTSTSATLSLTATDVTSGVYQVRFSNDGVWDTEPWEAQSTNKDWTLPPGDGTKTVYCQIKDNAGLQSETYSDSILLDTAKPSIGTISREPEVPDEGEKVTITVDVTDGESGVHNITISYSTNEGATWTDVPMNRTTGDTYVGEIPGLPAETNVQYKITAYDKAGNFEVDDQLGQSYVYTVIPEFPTRTSILLILILLTAALVIYKRRLLVTD